MTTLATFLVLKYIIRDEDGYYLCWYTALLDGLIMWMLIDKLLNILMK